MRLGLSSNGKDARRIPAASGTQNLSSPVSLVGGKKYYIEVTYVQHQPDNSQQLIQVSWKRLDTTNGFHEIDEAFFSPYTGDDNKYEFKMYDENFPDALSCAQFVGRSTNKFLRPEKLPVPRTSCCRSGLSGVRV